MKTTQIFSKAVLVLAMVAGMNAQAGGYKLDQSHGEVGFSVKHLMISNVKGSFKKFSGTFDYDEAKKELKNINVEIETASIDTNEPDRDKHLKSPDFFEVEKFAKMTFKGEKVEFKDGKPVKVTGTLTMHGVSKPVTLEVAMLGNAVDPWGNARIAFSASATVQRKDFGLNWNKKLDAGGVVVGEDVQIKIEGEAIAQKK